MGCAEAAVITNESYRDLAAARVIIEAAGGRIYKTDGTQFFLNEYLSGERINEPLLVTAPNILTQVRSFLQPIS
jgi:myo-inositol-1(or 4)-monophosphatase